MGVIRFTDMRAVNRGREEDLMEVKRTLEGQWFTRLDQETWDRKRTEAFESLQAGNRHKLTWSPEMKLLSSFQQLTGHTWEDWQNAIKASEEPGGPRFELDCDKASARQWQRLPESLEPAVETAYQRYLRS